MANICMKLIPVAQAGVNYIKGQAGSAGLLSNLVLQQLAGSQNVFALLPENTPLEKARDFDGHNSMGRPAAEKKLAEHMLENWGETAQIIYLDPWMAPDDFATHPPEQPYFQHNGKMYYMPDMADATAAVNASRVVRSWCVIGFIISPPVPLPQSGSEVDADFLAQLALNTQAIFLSGYDQESYVIWEK